MKLKSIITLMLCAIFGLSTMAQEMKTFTVNGVSFNMVYVQGGTFQMGAQNENPNGANYDSEASSWEQPVHSVTLSDYYIGETEVTQELWEAVMGTNIEQQQKTDTYDYGLFGVGSTYPMYYISWEDCQEFVEKLNQLTGKNFSLPTEAQWEYAARGGNKSRGYKYSGSNTIDEVAWYCGNAMGVDLSSSDYGTHRVGTKLPNELGLYDMSGNVYEWCSDWDGDYSTSSQTNPTGPTTGSDRVLRGGGWGNGARGCRVAYRVNGDSDYRRSTDGFRLACGR